ncbi:MAG: 50S ribosomal protein L27 [Candidatus Nanoperiomorbaceae bacterium]
MSHVKAGGTANNVHNNAGHRLGVKRFGGQTVTAGEVIVRQVGASKIAGAGTYVSRNFTIHAAQPGVVKFVSRRVRTFTGKTVPRTEVQVVTQ